MAQSIDPELAAQMLAKGFEASSEGELKAVATGRHVDIDQTVAVPPNLTEQQLNARTAKVRKLTLEKACRSDNTRIMVANGVTISWRFRDGDGKLLTSVDVDQAACRAVISPAA